MSAAVLRLLTNVTTELYTRPSQIFRKHRCSRWITLYTGKCSSSPCHFSSATTSEAVVEATVNERDHGVRVQSPAWPHSVTFSPLWLRDHCRCPECFNHSTFQRRRTLDLAWLHVQPSDINIENGHLSIQWKDGHQTLYNMDWLWENSFEGRNHSTWVKRVLWNRNRFDMTNVPNVTYQNLLEDEGAVAQLVEMILLYGFGFISSTPPTVEATQLAVERVSQIQRTFWGSGLCVVTPDEVESDMAYGSEKLSLHTDCNYLHDGPGLQIFHLLQPSSAGGETILADGFYVASQLKSRNPSAYDILSSAVVQFEYREGGGRRFYKNTDTILKHDPITKELYQIRFSMNDLSPLSCQPQSAIDGFYSAYAAFSEELLGNETKLRLGSGDILLLDNWRVLHAREAFTGRRTLVSAYVGRSDFLNRARTLGVVNGLY